MRVTHFDSAYSVSPKARQILRKKQFICDAEPGDTERLDDLEERHDKLEDRVNNQTSAYGEVRAQQKKDGDRLDTHEKILHTLGGTDDELSRATPKATDPDDEVPSDDSVGGSVIYGPKGQPSGYTISTGDQLRQMNNKNRRKFGIDDGPSQPGDNQSGQAGTISGNSSKTQQSLNLGQTWTGTNRTQDAAVFRALAPDYYRRQQASTTDLIRTMQAKQNKTYGIKR